jgi:hypothetical protein
MDELLLQLEAALGVPAAPEWQAARHDLKLRALKGALEGRQAQAIDPARHAEWLAAVLRQSSPTEVQSERLQTLIGALRTAAHRFT